MGLKTLIQKVSPPATYMFIFLLQIFSLFIIALSSFIDLVISLNTTYSKLTTTKLKKIKRGAIPAGSFSTNGGHYHYYPFSHNQHYPNIEPNNPEIIPSNGYYQQIKPVHQHQSEESAFEPQTFPNPEIQYLPQVPQTTETPNFEPNFFQPPEYSIQHNPPTYHFASPQFIPKSNKIVQYNPLTNPAPQTFGAQNNVYRAIVPTNLYNQQNQRLYYNNPVGVNTAPLQGLSQQYRVGGIYPALYPLMLRNPNASLNNYRKLMAAKNVLERTTPKTEELKVSSYAKYPCVAKP